VDLSQDEQTVLLIAAEGEWMAPIGRWKDPTLSLAEKGLLSRGDDFNYCITPAGRTQAKRLDQATQSTLVEMTSDAAVVQGRIRDFAEQAAQLLAQAAKASERVTGDTPQVAAEKWSGIIYRRALELL